MLPSFGRIANSKLSPKTKLLASRAFAGLIETGLGEYAASSCRPGPCLGVRAALTEVGRWGCVGANLVNQRLMQALRSVPTPSFSMPNDGSQRSVRTPSTNGCGSSAEIPFDERIFELAADDIAAAVTAVKVRHASWSSSIWMTPCRAV
jgi:hypothetical protein